MKLPREEIQARVEALGPWFHNMEVGGVRTAPDHVLFDYPNVKFQRFAKALPADLSGRSVLDIGCNGGFYSLEMKRRGATRVLGIDSLAAADLLGSPPFLRGRGDAGAVAADYPFAETAVFERPDFPRLSFIEQRYSGDDSNWWVPNRACAEAMLRSAGFTAIEQVEAEVFLCRCADAPADAAVYPRKARG